MAVLEAIRIREAEDKLTVQQGRPAPPEAQTGKPTCARGCACSSVWLALWSPAPPVRLAIGSSTRSPSPSGEGDCLFVERYPPQHTKARLDCRIHERPANRHEQVPRRRSVAKAQLEWAGVCDPKQSRSRPTGEQLRIVAGGSRRGSGCVVVGCAASGVCSSHRWAALRPMTARDSRRA